MTESIRLNGAISHDKESDWDIGYLGIEAKDIQEIKDRQLGKFNQGKHYESTNACTIVGAVREYCYQNNMTFSDGLVIDVINYCVKNSNYVIGEGWSSAMGMSLVRKYFNNESNFVRVSYDDLLVPVIYANKNVLGITFKGNSQWNIDSSDGELSGNKYEPTTYGHRTTTEYDIENKHILVNDSYYGSKGNTYSIPHLLQLVNGVNVYPTFYYWIPKVKQESEVKDLYKVIQGYDLIINGMMAQYRTLKEEKQDKERKLLLKEVGIIRREKERYVNLLKKTQI